MHLLEVVEHQQQLRSRRWADERFEQRPVPAARARRAPWRWSWATSVGSLDRRERHEEDAVAERRRAARAATWRREARLAGAARAGERQQPRRAAAARPPRPTSRLRPTKRRQLGRQVVRRASSVRSGGNSAGRSGDDELAESLGPIEVLQAVLAEVAQRDVGGQRCSRPARASTRDAAPGRRAPPPRCARPGGRRGRRSCPPPSVPSPVCRPMRTRTVPASAGQGSRGEGSLRGGRRGDRRRRAAEDDEERVALGRDLHATGRLECARAAAPGGARAAGRKPGAERGHQPGRAFDVGEEEGQRSRRQVRSLHRGAYRRPRRFPAPLIRRYGSYGR